MEYYGSTPAREKRPRRKNGKGLLIALAIVLVLAALAAVAFFVFDLPAKLGFGGPAPTPFFAEGQVQALRLAPVGDSTGEEALREYYQNAVAYAAGNGYNTLIFEGKKGLAAYWRDGIFPAPAAITEGDGFLSKLDPLALLCEAAEGSGVQIWVEVDAYAANGYEEGMKGTAATLAKQNGGANHTRFASNDSEYRDLLRESLSALPQKYPIAAVVLSGFDAQQDAGTTMPATPETQPGGAARAPDAWGENVAPQVTTEVWAESLDTLVASLRANWRQNEYATRLALQFDGEGASALTPTLAQGMAGRGDADCLLPTLAMGEGLESRLAQWAGAGLPVVLWLQDAADADVVAGAQTTFANGTDSLLMMAATQPGFSGAVFAGYPAAAGPLQGSLAVLKTTLQPVEGTLPTGFTTPPILAVNYPAQGEKVTTETVYIMGTSDPAKPLYLDGNEIAVRAPGGAFGVLVHLVEGENLFDFSQGDTTLQLTLTRPAPSGGGGAATPGEEYTGPEVQPGQAVRITAQIASALVNYSDESSIAETLQTGAVGIIREVATDANKKPFAYKLTSGNWVYAANCELIADGTSAFTGLAAAADEAGGEWLTFEGSGTPAAYVAYGENKIEITMYDTTFSLPEGFASDYVQSAAVIETEDGGVRLTLQLAKGIWGYSLEYTGGQTRLYLKPPAQRSGDANSPLAGIRVMLDPGHGGTDAGTPGLMWQTGPHEREVNLELAQTIAYRLRQLGAEVILTREDNETALTLGERLAKITEFKPDFFLSVHHNSAELVADLNNAMGVHAFYHHPYSVPPSGSFAQHLLDNVAAETGRTGNTASESYFYVTRTTVCPAVLFEYGFMISPAEFEDVTSKEGMFAAACGTANAILETLLLPG